MGDKSLDEWVSNMTSVKITENSREMLSSKDKDVENTGGPNNTKNKNSMHVNETLEEPNVPRPPDGKLIVNEVDRKKTYGDKHISSSQ